MNAQRWKRPVWIIVGTVVILAMLAVVAIVAWPNLSGTDDEASGETQSTTTTASGEQAVPDPPVTTPTPRIVPMAISDKAPTADGIAAQLAKPLSNKNVADLSGIVIDPESGKTLWERKADDARVPASSMKLLTGAALLASVDPNDRLITKVVQGADPGTIVFVGGGDVTLSARPEGTATVLPGGPTVADLAAQVKASGVEVSKIVLDTSYWSGPELAEGWHAEDIRGTPQIAKGYITKMSALMVDDDRTDPSVQYSPRTGEPAMTAGKALAHALGVDDVPIEMGEAPPDAEVLGQVSSQPMATLLAQALERSDNVLAEALARETAIARGAAPSFDGVSAAILQALGDMGIDTDGVVVKDGSGMSTMDRVPVTVLARVMAAAVSGEDANQRILLTGLPLAGVSGTLAENDRFQQKETKAGRGWVRAKTGSINVTATDVTYALVGYVPDVDGRILVFAFNSNGVNGNPSRYAQDALATALRLCGCSG